MVTVETQPGVPIRVVKYVAYQTSRSVAPRDLAARCHRTLDRTLEHGFDAVVEAQRANLDRFWDAADVVVVDRNDPVRSAAGGALEPVPAVPGVVAGRGRQHPGQGAHRGRPTTATTSGTPRRTCCRSSPTPSPGSPGTSCGSATACCPRRASAPRSSTFAGRCSRGGRSTATRRRRSIRRAPRSTTSTPTSPTPSGGTSTSRATSGSWPRSAPRSSWRRLGCGRTSASTATTVASTSTA